MSRFNDFKLNLNNRSRLFQDFEPGKNNIWQLILVIRVRKLSILRVRKLIFVHVNTKIQTSLILVYEYEYEN